MLQWQRENLKDIVLPGGSTLVQYVNDLLLVSKAYKNCLKDTLCLCFALAQERSLCISLQKRNLCHQEVNCVGFISTEGQRLVDPEQVQAMVEITLPATKKQLRIFRLSRIVQSLDTRAKGVK